MKRKGFIQETALFSIIVGLAAVFFLILAADAPSELQNILDSLKQASMVGAGFIPVVGIYLFWKQWSS